MCSVLFAAPQKSILRNLTKNMGICSWIYITKTLPYENLRKIGMFLTLLKVKILPYENRPFHLTKKLYSIYKLA